MTRGRKICLAVAAVVVALLVVAWFLAPEPERLPLRFWIRTDDKTEYVYATRGGDALDDWRWQHGPPTSAGFPFVMAEWRRGSALGLARRFGAVPMTDGHVVGAILPPSAEEDPWRECLSTNRAWPEEAAPDAEFAGTWAESGGSLETSVERSFSANGDTTRREGPGGRWRWGRVGDVVVLGVWSTRDNRWTMANALIVSSDGRTYRTALGGTGHRTE